MPAYSLIECLFCLFTLRYWSTLLSLRVTCTFGGIVINLIMTVTVHCRPRKLLRCVTSMRKFFQCDKLHKSLVTTFVTRHIGKNFPITNLYSIIVKPLFILCNCVSLYIWLLAGRWLFFHICLFLSVSELACNLVRFNYHFLLLLTFTDFLLYNQI